MVLILLSAKCMVWALLKVFTASSLPRYVSKKVVRKGASHLISASAGIFKPLYGESNDFMRVILMEEDPDWCILT